MPYCSQTASRDGTGHSPAPKLLAPKNLRRGKMHRRFVSASQSTLALPHYGHSCAVSSSLRGRLPARPQRTRAARPERERGVSFVQLLLHLSQFHEGVRQLLFIILGIHCRFLVLQRVNLLLQLVFLVEQRSLRRIVGGLQARAQAQQCEARHEHPLPVSGFAHRLTCAHIVENRVLGREPLLRIVKCRGLLHGISKRLHCTDGIVLVGVRSRVFECFHPVPCKHCGVLFCS